MAGGSRRPGDVIRPGDGMITVQATLAGAALAYRHELPRMFWNSIPGLTTTSTRRCRRANAIGGKVGFELATDGIQLTFANLARHPSICSCVTYCSRLHNRQRQVSYTRQARIDSQRRRTPRLS